MIVAWFLRSGRFVAAAAAALLRRSVLYFYCSFGNRCGPKPSVRWTRRGLCPHPHHRPFAQFVYHFPHFPRQPWRVPVRILIGGFLNAVTSSDFSPHCSSSPISCGIDVYMTHPRGVETCFLAHFREQRLVYDTGLHKIGLFSISDSTWFWTTNFS